jgi:hypothetical protein
MSNDGLVECLLCGKQCQSLGHHLRWNHALSADQYRDQHGIRRGTSLASPATRARFADRLRARIERGELAEHLIGSAERARRAAKAGIAAKQELRAAGVRFSAGKPPIARAAIETIVEAVEAGAKVATAVKRQAISYSSYHAGLARNPDLKLRHEAARKLT